MLTCLRVHNLAIIDRLEIELGPGLTVISGETGAGKSILLAALGLVLGARARSDIVRAGCEQAEVEALFDLTEAPDARERLREATGDAGDELVVRRVVSASGRSRAYLDGRLATAGQLQAVSRALVDLCSQHEHHVLVDPTTHLPFLDAFAKLDPDRDDLAASWRRWRQAADALDALADQVRDRAEREALLRFQLSEIDAIDPQADEESELEQEHDRLSHADRLARVTHEAEAELYGDDRSLSVRLARIQHNLDTLRGVDPELDAHIDQLASLHTDLEEIGRELGRYSRGLTFDPERLHHIQERLSALRRLQRRHGGTQDALIAARERMAGELSRFDGLEDELDALELQRQRAVDDLARRARALSERRGAEASRLGAAITTELQSLGMGGARIEIDIARTESRGAGPEVGGATCTTQGIDRVEFLISPNPGEPPRPLHRIASGGELSRSLLAIKRVLAQVAPAGLYVFDEVDTGVGGAVAEAIGHKLAEVAQHRQVLCITHQAPIAACGDAHLRVAKTEAEGRTRSTIVPLSEDERVDELARMMGGAEITAATREAARDLLRSVRRRAPQ